MNDLESQVLKVLCNNEASIMDRGNPLPSTYISTVLRVSPYRVRKALKSLKDQELIRSYAFNTYDDYRERYCIIRGYRLTYKAKKTKEYSEAIEKEIRVCKEIFNIDVSSTLKGEING